MPLIPLSKRWTIRWIGESIKHATCRTSPVQVFSKTYSSTAMSASSEILVVRDSTLESILEFTKIAATNQSLGPRLVKTWSTLA